MIIEWFIGNGLWVGNRIIINFDRFHGIVLDRKLAYLTCDTFCLIVHVTSSVSSVEFPGRQMDEDLQQKIECFNGATSGLRQFLVNESPLKMLKNAFYFTLKALFVLKIFKFLC